MLQAIARAGAAYLSQHSVPAREVTK
jgi:hypothetical protein